MVRHDAAAKLWRGMLKVSSVDVIRIPRHIIRGDEAKALDQLTSSLYCPMLDSKHPHTECQIAILVLVKA